VLLLSVVVLTGGCDLFKELESADSAPMGTAGDTATDSDTDAPAPDGLDCTRQGSTCSDQDTVSRCEGDMITDYDCTAVCGRFTNFSCVGFPPGDRACWCVEPGLQKVLSCTELEDCLRDCSLTVGTVCADQCFTRTTQPTIRLYGALVHCAQSGCEADCLDSPAQCGACVEQTMVSGSHGCALPRSLCDADKNDEPGYP
jgi:hypothetical protein